MIHIIVSCSRSGRTYKVLSLLKYLIMFTFVNERVIQFTVFVRVDLPFANAKFTVTSSNATNSH
jgi:hypothetical protein